MSDKKNENFGCGMACILVPAIGIMGFMLAFLPSFDKTDDSGYIVTDKGANTIAYYSIKNPADMHVMKFTDTISFYPYINVGDTISGVHRHIDRKVAPSDYTTNHGTHQVITSVNGKSLYEWREIARRDSIIRTMRQKQR